MPHYPEEIEYSDKYFDDFYEYRHVILPKHIFKKIQKGIFKILSSKASSSANKNGEALEFNNLEAGLITKLIDQSLTFFCFEEPKTQIQILVCLLQGLVPHID